MKKNTIRHPGTLGAAFIWILLPAAQAAADGGFRILARDLSRAAQRAHIARVAVLPFVPADGSSPKEGWNISEKLVTQLVRQDRVQAVERSLLRALMEEQRLGRTGIVDAETIKRIGKVFAVDGVVTGSFVSMGNETMVNARLIDVQTGLIIAAAERKTDREWFDSLGLQTAAPEADPWPVDVPRLEIEAPFTPVELRDQDSCEDAARRVDRLERSVLDLKARYWAGWLRKGGRLSQLKFNPGTTINDPELRREFYRRMQAWYDAGQPPELTPAEVQRFVDHDQRAFALHRECNL